MICVLGVFQLLMSHGAIFTPPVKFVWWAHMHWLIIGKGGLLVTSRSVNNSPNQNLFFKNYQYRNGNITGIHTLIQLCLSRKCEHNSLSSWVLSKKKTFPLKGLGHHVQDTCTNQVETGENHNIMFLQCTNWVQNGAKWWFWGRNMGFWAKWVVCMNIILWFSPLSTWFVNVSPVHGVGELNEELKYFSRLLLSFQGSW